MPRQPLAPGLRNRCDRPALWDTATIGEGTGLFKNEPGVKNLRRGRCGRGLGRMNGCQKASGRAGRAGATRAPRGMRRWVMGVTCGSGAGGGWRRAEFGGDVEVSRHAAAPCGARWLPAWGRAQGGAATEMLLSVCPGEGGVAEYGPSVCSSGKSWQKCSRVYLAGGARRAASCVYQCSEQGISCPSGNAAVVRHPTMPVLEVHSTSFLPRLLWETCTRRDFCRSRLGHTSVRLYPGPSVFPCALVRHPRFFGPSVYASCGSVWGRKGGWVL